MARTVIYRKSDRLIAGYVTPPHSITVEIENLCNSELGGVPEDYIPVDCPVIPKGFELAISLDGTPEVVPDAASLERARVRQNAVHKIQRATGLTDTELRAVWPSSV